MTPNADVHEDLKGAGFVAFKVFFDRDKAGQDGAHKMVVALRGAGLASVAFELPPDLGDKADVEDLHRREGANLRAALEALPPLPEPQTAGRREGKTKGTQGQKVFLEDVEPWDQEVDGTELLHKITTTLLHFVAMPESADAAALDSPRAHPRGFFCFAHPDYHEPRKAVWKNHASFNYRSYQSPPVAVFELHSGGSISRGGEVQAHPLDRRG